MSSVNPLTTSLPSSTSISTSTRYSLEVEYIHDASMKQSFIDRRSRLYVEASLGDAPAARSRSIKKDASPSWKHTFTLLTSEQTSELTVEVIQLSALKRTNTIVGSSKFKLSDLVAVCITGNEVKLDLSSQGQLRLYFKVINEITYTAIKLRNGHADGRISKLRGFTSEESGFVASQMGGNGDLYQDIGNLLQKLDVFAKIAGDFAAIEPHLAAVWLAISALYKWVSNQLERDKKVVGLVRRLLEKFQFVDGNSSLRNKILFLKPAIERLLKTTGECCDFIKRYFDRMFIRRMVSFRDSQRIGHFERLIDNLSVHFEEGSKRYKEALFKQSSLKTVLNPIDMEGFGRPTCLENTQVDTRRHINEWIDSETGKSVFWLYGVAGSGKSTIATTIAEELRTTHQLGAFLFFIRATSKPQDVIRTMAYQLAMSNIEVATHVDDGTLGNAINHSSIDALLEKLILHPLRAAASEVKGPIIIILDALDECGEHSTREELLRAFKTAFSKLPVNFRLLITSRPELDLYDLLHDHPSVQSLKLDTESSKRDVSLYLSLTLAELFTKRGTEKPPDDWPWDESIAFLGVIACGLFIWASTACKHIKQSKLKEFQALNKLISDIRSHGQAEFGITTLYSTVLHSTSIPWNDDEIKLRFARVLYLIVGVEIALSTDDIDIILGLSPGSASNLISQLQSVLTHAPGSLPRIRPLHASFGDFLTSCEQSQNPWYIDIASNREYIHNRCLNSFDIIDRTIHEISGYIETFSKQRDRMLNLQNRFAKRLSDDLRIACLAWPQQFRISTFSHGLSNKLTHFLQTHLLTWIKVMFGMGKLDLVNSVLEDCIAWAAGNNASIKPLIEDARKNVADIQPCLNSFRIMDRMLRFNICDIETSFKLNKDISGLHKRIEEQISNDLKNACLSWAEQLFISPPSRIVICTLSHFLHNHLLSWLEVLSLIKKVDLARPALEKAIKWVAENNTSLETFLHDACEIISTFETPISESLPHIYVSMLPLACHSSNVASHYSQCISLVTKVEIIGGGPQGSLSKTFNGHTDAIFSVAYSPDGKHIGSGSGDCTIRVWNAKSGELVAGPFEGHRGIVYSVSYSPDGKRIVSSSKDRTVIVWDAKSGELISGPLESHSDFVLSVAYSPNGKNIASGSDDGTVTVRNVKTGNLVTGPFIGHSSYVFSVAYSPDGQYIASGSHDRTIRVWNAESGKRVAGPFEGHLNWVWSVSYSPDGKRIVSGSEDRTVIVWDSKSGELIAGPFKGHSGPVRSVSYSPDGKQIVSGSIDRTIRIWDALNGASPSSSINSEWELSEDGWIHGKRGELLLWVPPDMRMGLYYPYNSVTLNYSLLTRVHFTEDKIGENWRRCIELEE